jgi:hypothetical protein
MIAKACFSSVVVVHAHSQHLILWARTGFLLRLRLQS